MRNNTLYMPNSFMSDNVNMSQILYLFSNNMP